MKFITIITLFISVSLYAKSEKMILLYVEMENCQWCKKMDREVFEDSSYLKRIQKLYTLKRVKKSDPYIPYFIKTRFYPTTYILSSNKSEIIDELPGYMKAEDYVEYLETLYEVENN